MRPSLRDVVQRLVDERTLSSDDAALLQRSLTEANAANPSAPWYVRLLSAVGAWIAAAMFCWVLAVADVFDAEAVSMVLGVVLLGGASAVRRRARHDLLVQCCIAAAVVGESLLLFGAAELFDWNDEHIAVAAIPLNVAVLVVFADPVGRFLAASFAVASVAYTAYELNQPVAYQLTAVALGALAAATWELRWFENARWRQVRPPAGVALAGGLLGMLAWDVAEHWSQEQGLGGVATGGLLVVSAAVVLRIFLAHGAARPTVYMVAAFATVGLFGAASWSTPGILAAVLVLALGYHRREIVLIGLAFVFLLAFAGWYYYSLQITLLQKSAVLILSGGVLLGVRQWLRRAPQAPSPQGASA